MGSTNRLRVTAIELNRFFCFVFYGVLCDANWGSFKKYSAVGCERIVSGVVVAHVI